MVEAGFIQHASESAKQTLVEGFIIFCFTPKSSWVEKTDGKFQTISSHGSQTDVVQRDQLVKIAQFQTMQLTSK